MLKVKFTKPSLDHLPSQFYLTIIFIYVVFCCYSHQFDNWRNKKQKIPQTSA